MQFQVPQFIERELKIVGPLTFKQFLFVGGGGLGCILLYLFLAQKSFFFFILISLLVAVAGLALAFVQVQGRPLPTVIANFSLFIFSVKNYFWKKKVVSPKIIRPVPRKEEIEKKPALKISEKSQLQSLATKLETGMR